MRATSYDAINYAPPQSSVTAKPAQPDEHVVAQQEIAVAQAPAAGYSTAPAQYQGQAAKSGIAKLYNFLFFLPCILFSVFSVLLFLFFLGDYASVSFMGETEGTGSLYNLLGESEMLEMSGYGGVIYTLLALAAISLIFTIVFLNLTISKEKRVKTVNIGGRTLFRTTVLAYVSFVLYFILFIVSCVGAGQVGGDELDAGAPLICTLVFSLIFGLLGGAAIVIRHLLAKKDPTLAESEMSVMQEQAASAQRQEAIENGTLTPAIAARQANVQSNDAVPTTSAASDAQKLDTIKDIKRLTRRRRLSSLFGFSILCPLVGIIGMFVTLGRSIWDWNPAQLEREKKTITGRIVLNIVFALITFGYGIMFLAYMIPMVSEQSSTPAEILTMLNVMCAYFFFVGSLHIIGVISAICAFSPLRRLGLAFYGKAEPNTLIDQPVLTMKDLQEAEVRSGARKKFADGALLGVCCLVMAALIAFGCVVGSFFITGFPVKEAKRLSLGRDTRSDVLETLGNPDYPTDENDYEDASAFYYYSGEIKKYMDEMKSLEEEAEKALESMDLNKIAELEKKAEELEKKMAKIESYEEIAVYFSTYATDSSSSSSKTYYVSEVSVDMKAKVDDSESRNKKVDTITLSSESVSAYEYDELLKYFDSTKYGSSRLSAKITYTDESYRNVYVPLSALTNAETNSSDSITLKWQDNWISSNDYYTASLNVQGNGINNTYTVSFNLNGGSYNGYSYIEDREGSQNDYVELPVLDNRDGYTFDGWYTNSNFSSSSKVTDSYFYPDQDRTLYAKWIRNVTFHLNGGRYNGSSSDYALPCDEDDSVSLITPTKSGYTFDGWYTSSNFYSSSKVTGSYFSPYSNGNYDLYAKWVYTVTFDLNGGRYNGSSNNYKATCEEYDNVSLITPTRSGYTFDGWYTNASFSSSSKVTGSYFYPDENCTLYAKWTVSVTFNLNGGRYNNSSNNYTATCDEGSSVSLITPTRSGYTFGGWYTNSNLSSSYRVTGTSYSPNENCTLYAKWTAVSSTPYEIVTDSSLFSNLSSLPHPSGLDSLGSASVYGFTTSGSTYTSNNHGSDNSNAIMMIGVTNGTYTVSFNWSVSSESSYDRAYIWVYEVNGSNAALVETYVDGSSGTNSGSLEIQLTQNQCLVIVYSKDGSQNSGSDEVKITNFSINA